MTTKSDLQFYRISRLISAIDLLCLCLRLLVRLTVERNNL